jgi:hypothetical protein
MALASMTGRQLFASIVGSAVVALAVAAHLANAALARQQSPYARAIYHLDSEVMVRPILVGLAVFVGVMLLCRFIFHDINRRKNT